MPSVHINEHDLNLYVRKTLGSEQTAAVQLHLPHCEECRDKLALSVFSVLEQLSNGTGSNNRRAATRIRSDQQGSLTTLLPISSPRLAVRIVDISSTGFGLLVDSCLEAGALVKVQLGLTISTGTVRYCRPAEGNRFFAGILIQTTRSTPRPSPEHFEEVNRLLSMLESGRALTQSDT